MSARRPVSMWSPRRQDGAAAVEFFVIFLVAITLIMTVLQMGLFMVAKNTVNLATFAAARAGAASGGDMGQMKVALAKGLSGLYVAKGLRAVDSNGLTDVSAGNYVLVQGAAYSYVYLGLLSEIKILNPTKKAFTDFGVPKPDGKPGRIIPATGLLTDTAVGASSQQTRADALLLKIQVRHCYELIFPMIPSLSTDILCAARNGVIIESQAVVRMTAPAVESNF